MARFVQHEPCPSCGSRDNLGRYDDGSAHCFGGCGHYEAPTSLTRRTFTVKKITEDEERIPKLPDDTGTNYSAKAVEWLAMYHVSVEKAITHGVRWSDSRQQLIFLLEDGCWQARNFSQPAIGKPKRKYFTAGNVNDSIKLYLTSSPLDRAREGQQSDIDTSGGTKKTHGTDAQSCREMGGTLAVVEDCVSAIRISSQCDAMPVLGSHVASQKLLRIGRLYKDLIIWLDSDKLKEARELARRAQMVGLSAVVVHTPLDPKCYTDKQLKEYLS